MKQVMLELIKKGPRTCVGDTDTDLDSGTGGGDIGTEEKGKDEEDICK